jgi:hypothetical protein
MVAGHVARGAAAEVGEGVPRCNRLPRMINASAYFGSSARA